MDIHKLNSCSRYLILPLCFPSVASCPFPLREGGNQHKECFKPWVGIPSRMMVGGQPQIKALLRTSKEEIYFRAIYVMYTVCVMCHAWIYRAGTGWKQIKESFSPMRSLQLSGNQRRSCKPLAAAERSLIKWAPIASLKHLPRSDQQLSHLLQAAETGREPPCVQWHTGKPARRWREYSIYYWNWNRCRFTSTFTKSCIQLLARMYISIFPQNTERLFCIYLLVSYLTIYIFLSEAVLISTGSTVLQSLDQRKKVK